MFRIQNKELDLLAAYNRKEGPSKSSKVLKYVSIPLGLFLVFAMAFIFIFVMNRTVQNKIDDVQLLNEEIQLKIDATDKEPYYKLATLKATYSSLQSVDNTIASLPELTKKQVLTLKNSLLSNMTLNSLSFDQEAKTIAASFTSMNVQNIEKYISNLKTKYQMTNISYNGYQQTKKTNTVGTGEFDALIGREITTTSETTFYSFSIVILLDGGAQ